MPDERPRRRHRRAEEAPPVCAWDDCKLRVLDPTSKFCVMHQAAMSAQQTLKRDGARAVRRGNQAAGAAYQVVAAGIDIALPLLTPWVTSLMDQLGRQPQRPLAAPPPRRDPFAALGLPPSASADDVRKMQRKLAAIYHADHGGDEAAAAKLAEINAAAAECLKACKTR